MKRKKKEPVRTDTADNKKKQRKNRFPFLFCFVFFYGRRRSGFPIDWSTGFFFFTEFPKLDDRARGSMVRRFTGFLPSFSRWSSC